MFRIRFFMLVIYLLGICLFPLAAQSIQPVWVSTPHAIFSENDYLVGVGIGNSRHAAERDALRLLVTRFGLSLEAVEMATTLLRDVVVDGAASWTLEADYYSNIMTFVRMDNLMGARIHEYWMHGEGTHYALAVLNRESAIKLYSGIIRANQNIIDNLTSMHETEINTFDGFSRFQLAAVFADTNFAYGAILRVLDPSQSGIINGDYFRRRAQEIIREIPIGINVRNDRGGRIQGAFAGIFAGFGFRTAGTNPRFVLDVNVSTWPDSHRVRGVELAWIEINANLVDTNTRAVLLPYGFNFRSDHPHRTLQGAENLAFNDAVQRIGREYGNLLSNYLAQLLPQR